jgi:benzil reductase ((S)-benzoin forming)
MTKTERARFALVTGTSSGIGAVLARRLLASGWHVLGVARRSGDLDHADYEHVAVDLADTGAFAAIETRVTDVLRGREWGRVALVNNAALAGTPGPLERAGAEELARVHLVNVVAPTWLMGLFVRRTPPATPLRIVNVSSGAAQHATPGLAAYCSSKAALRMAGQVLAAELESPARNTPAPRDTAILSYEPGVVETPMQQTTRDTSPEDFPWVGLFKEFKARGIVVAPEGPAAEIAGFLEADGGDTFTERRFSG